MLLSKTQSKKQKFLFIGSLLLFFSSHAQLLVNQGQTIYVSGVDLSIGGSAINNGTITNKGIVTITGDWINNNKYIAGNGLFVLDGDVAQSITHNSDSFHILTLKGNGDKALKDEARIVHDLQFGNPVILSTQPATGAIIILDGGTITGAANNAYVDGLLYHEGIGKKDYPIGKNGRYLPVILENITSDISGPITGVELFESNTGAQPGQSLLSVSNVRYVELRQKLGTLNGTPITLSIGDDETITSANDIVIAEANSQNGIYRSLGQSTVSATTGQAYITSSGLVTGSFFAIAIGKTLDASAVYIPTAFSPKATNQEDQVIKIYSDLLSPDNFEFKVFSKWGNVIFESSSLNEMQTKGWNGIEKNSSDASSGTYTYSMRGKFFNGKAFEKSGSITLIK